jgi:hypothetical protein
MGGYEIMEGVVVMEGKKYTQEDLDKAREGGFDDGFDEGGMDAHDEGYDEGYEVGYREGYDAGKSEGIFQTENKYHAQGYTCGE